MQNGFSQRRRNTNDHNRMSNLKAMSLALDKAKNIKDVLTKDFVQELTIQNYQAVTGRQDGKNWFHGEMLAMLNIFAEKPALAKCDRMSIWGCLQAAARSGLSIADGHLDLIPYGTTLKAEANYRGLREQLRRLPELKFIGEAQVVFKDDVFKYDKVNSRVLEHTGEDAPKVISLDNNIKAAYVRIEFQDGKVVDVVMWQSELIAARKKSKNKSEEGPWNQFAAEMVKKTVTKRAAKIFKRATVHQVANDAFDKFNIDVEEEEETTDVQHEEVKQEPEPQPEREPEQPEPAQEAKVDPKKGSAAKSFLED
jgi:phage RecT family recombinase